MNVHSSYNPPKLETTQISSKGGTVKLTVSHLCHRVLLSNKMNKLLKHTTWMELQRCMQSEQQHSLKDSPLCCIVLGGSVMSELSVTPWTITHQTPLSMGSLQARILEWVAMPSSRGSSQLRDRTQVSQIAGEFFPVWATREAHTVWLLYMTFPKVHNYRKRGRRWKWLPWIKKMVVEVWGDGVGVCLAFQNSRRDTCGDGNILNLDCININILVTLP